ncbi:16034_t:CDS:2, partial [Cetraspora pellucida]
QFSIGISHEAYRNDVIKCSKIKSNKLDNEYPRTSNPRFVPGTKTIVLKNGIILNGKGENILGDLILKNGLIHAIGQNLSDEDEAIVIDVKKKYITPGLVDMHSHATISSWPFLTGSDDVLTGSLSLMSGEGFVIKMRPVDTSSVDDMGIYAKTDTEKERVWRWLKMACGENPKAQHSPRKEAPTTRLGEAWLFRELFAEARALKQKQDDWCSTATKLSNNEQLNSYFPEDLQLESLVALLRGDVKLNIHCIE